MNKKILCIFICTIFLTSVFMPVVGVIKNKALAEDPKIWGEMPGDGNEPQGPSDVLEDIFEIVQPRITVFPPHVFNGESRTEVQDTTAYPYSAICELHCEWDGQHNGRPIRGRSGTGFIILNRGTDDVTGTGLAHHVMTCGHVIFNSTTDSIADSIDISPGRHGNSRPFGTITVGNNDVWVHPHYESAQDSHFDYAVVNLPITISDITGYFVMDYRGDGGGIGRWVHKPIRTAGYPAIVSGTLGNHRMFEDEMGHSRYMTIHMHKYRLDITPGQSGSPVWNDYQSNWPDGCHAISIVAREISIQLNDNPLCNDGPYFSETRWEEVVQVMNNDPPAEEVVDLTLEVADFTTTGNQSLVDSWWCIRPGDDTYSITADISNLGTEECNDAFRVGYILDSSTYLLYSHDLGHDDITLPVPSYANPIQSIISGTFLSTLPEGRYDGIKINVDALDTVAEWNEDNNEVVIENIKIDATKPVFDPWVNSFSPSGWVNTLKPTCSIDVTDDLSGINPDSLWYRYSTTGISGLQYQEWLPCDYCTPDTGGHQVSIFKNNVPFYFTGHDSETDNVVQFRVGDYAGNYRISAGYTVKIDTTEPGPVTVSSPSHPEDMWYKDGHVEFEWSPPSGDLSGIQGYQIAFSDSPNNIWTEVAVDLPSGTTTYEADVESGEWYFHIAAIDNANNRGPGVSVKVKVDTSAPGPWTNFFYEETSSNCYTCSIDVNEEHSGISTGGGTFIPWAYIRCGWRVETIFEWQDWESCTVSTIDSTTYKLQEINNCFPASATDKRVQFKVMDKIGNWGTSPERSIP